MGIRTGARRASSKPAQPSMGAQLFCLALLFALGMLGGYFYAEYCCEGSALSLSEYLAGYCVVFEDGGGGAVSLFSAVLLYFGYTSAAFLLGFTAIGVVAIPLLLAAFGFTSMFAVACFVMIYGRRGIALALAAMGVRMVVTLPCLLWVGARAWASSFALSGVGGGKRCAPVLYDKGYFYRLCVCVVLLLFGVCAEQYLTPYLFHLALAGLG